MQDANVRVTAVLVPHGPTFPTFAYRFDTEYGSVTFSGDTTYTDNIPTLAHRTDILVHEAINVRGWPGPDALKDHLLTSHVEVQKVGAVASDAQARRLVLSHVGDLVSPVLPVRQWTAWARQGYHGPVTVGRDLQVFTL
ncbi:MBL fold metallo-hydrolase [Microbacterium elymi]|uniref:MBL fold metallo-hydrolase n=1 Tax=Microbacterium elymi TaxID=2909587 RepID=A0ABY5NHU0_9MICO|nr:MBL fold metallo-hydrolase [Microbacterium elymi]UUT34760.1 MBL fold metallo-hydrolase [Microbacterium elymi]